jgi:Rv0078B-related antitoxin
MHMNETPEERLLLAFDLFEFGVDMQQRKLARENPRKTPQELDRLLTRWLQNPPDAPYGDGEGRPLSLSRFRN